MRKFSYPYQFIKSKSIVRFTSRTELNRSARRDKMLNFDSNIANEGEEGRKKISHPFRFRSIKILPFTHCAGHGSEKKNHHCQNMRMQTLCNSDYLNNPINWIGRILLFLHEWLPFRIVMKILDFSHQSCKTKKREKNPPNVLAKRKKANPH